MGSAWGASKISVPAEASSMVKRPLASVATVLSGWPGTTAFTVPATGVWPMRSTPEIFERAGAGGEYAAPRKKMGLVHAVVTFWSGSRLVVRSVTRTTYQADDV